MDFHESHAWHLMMVNVRADGQTVAHTSDLEPLPQRWESKGIGGSRTWFACSSDCCEAVADSGLRASGSSDPIAIKGPSNGDMP